MFTAGDSTRLRELLHPAHDRADVRFSLAFGQLGLSRSSLPHKLKQAEVYYILRGRCRAHVGSRVVTLRTGDLVYVPAGAVQWFENTGWQTMKFLCVVDPAWTKAGETLVGARAEAKRQKPTLKGRKTEG